MVSLFARNALFTGIILAGVSGCAGYPAIGDRFHPHAADPFPHPALKQDIDALLTDSLFPPSNVGIRIVSLTTGEVLYDLNAELLFTPGSNQKLLTAAAALATLGAGYQLKTDVYLDTIAGNRITVKGGGDPLLSTADLDSLALLVRTALPPGRAWVLAGDTSFFDDLYWGKGWMWDDEPDPTSMHISPLSVNGNAIRVHVHPGSRAGEAPSVAMEPETEFVSLRSTAITVADSPMQPLHITRLWREQSNVIEISGEIRAGDPVRTTQLSVRDPGRMFLILLAERLVRAGVEINGLTWDTVPSTGSRIVRYHHRLDSAVVYMNRLSDNLAAESILKVMGAEAHGVPGTAGHGLDVVRKYLAGTGIDTARFVLADASGISRYNLLSASVLTQLLSSLRKDPALFDIFHRSLPAPGENGSLSHRMKGTAAEGRIRAKTGTLSGVSSLSGYVQTEDGGALAFAILMQNFPGSVRNYRAVQDRIGVLLSTLKLGGL